MADIDPGSAHVRHAGLLVCGDEPVWDYVARDGREIVSKDPLRVKKSRKASPVAAATTQRSWRRNGFVRLPRYSAFSCTDCTARPDGSTMFFKLGSHSSAAAVEHATDGPPGTHSAAHACG